MGYWSGIGVWNHSALGVRILISYDSVQEENKQVCGKRLVFSCFLSLFSLSPSFASASLLSLLRITWDTLWIWNNSVKQRNELVFQKKENNHFERQIIFPFNLTSPQRYNSHDKYFRCIIESCTLVFMSVKSLVNSPTILQAISFVYQDYSIIVRGSLLYIRSRWFCNILFSLI